VLSFLREAALEDLDGTTDEELLQEAEADGEDVAALATSIRARFAQRLEEPDTAQAPRLHGLSAGPVAVTPAAEPRVIQAAGTRKVVPMQKAVLTGCGVTRMQVEGTRPLYRYLFGSADFNEAAQELRIRGEVAVIEPRPLRLLSALLRAGGSPLPRPALVDLLWRGEAAADAFDACVARLRGALRENAAFIATHAGGGFSFDYARGEVQPIHPAQAPEDGPRRKLRAGEAVPHAEGFTLESQLARSAGLEVWLARGPEPQVFKLALDGRRLESLAREQAIHKVLDRAMPDGRWHVRMRGSNLDRPPYFLASEPGGQDLAAWAARNGNLKKRSFADRLALCEQIAAAVAAVHAADLLHCNLAPGHILVAEEDTGLRVRLADFSSAKLLRPADSAIDPHGLTQHDPCPDELSCTPAYLAPERRRGAAASVASDVYALGLLLYQVLVADFGKRLDAGWENDIERKVLRSDIMAAVHRDPEMRISTVAKLTECLRHLEQREDELTRWERRGAQRAAWSRRWSSGCQFLASASAVLLVTVATFQFNRLSDARELAQQTALHERQSTLDGFASEVFGRDPVIRDHIASPGGQALLQATEQRARMRFAGHKENLGAALLTLSGDYVARGGYQKAQELQSEAVRLLSDARGPADVEPLIARYLLVRSLDMQGQYAQANARLQETDQLAGAQLKQATILTLVATWVRGGNELVQRPPGDAVIAYEEADALRLQVVPHDPAWQVRIQSNLAWCYVRTDRSQDAVTMLEKLDGAEFSRDRLGFSDWARLRITYGLALRNLKRFEVARKALDDVVIESRHGSDTPSEVTALALFSLAGTYQAQEGLLALAVETYRHVWAMVASSPSSEAALETEASLASTEYLTGHSAHALPHLQAAHDKLASASGPNAPATQLAAYYLALALCDSGQTDKAAGLAASLRPELLASADASGSWPERVEALQGQMLIGTGRAAEGRRHLAAAALAMEAKGVQTWLRKRLTRPAGALVWQEATPGSEPVGAGLETAYFGHPPGAPGRAGDDESRPLPFAAALAGAVADAPAPALQQLSSGATVASDRTVLPAGSLAIHYRGHAGALDATVLDSTRTPAAPLYDMTAWAASMRLDGPYAGPAADLAAAPAGRIALVIGNSHYEGGPWGSLERSKHDAVTISEALRRLQFEMVGCSGKEICLDATRPTMETAIAELVRKLKANPGAIALVYYAGHGVRERSTAPGEDTFLVPVGSGLMRASQLASHAVSVRQLIAQIGSAHPTASIVILDACRDTHLQGLSGGSAGVSGLAAASASNLIIAYTANPGQGISDAPAPGTDLGSYAGRLAEQLLVPGQSLADAFVRAGTQVSAATHGRQTPEVTIRLDRDLFLSGDEVHGPIQAGAARFVAPVL
jgi:non-specific serine/threonine protein kinase